MIRQAIAAAVLLFTLSVAVGGVAAAETVVYTYDAKGRLIKVVKSSSVNNGVTTEYTHDKAQNRVRVKVTGAP